MTEVTYLRDGAAEGLWTLLTESDAPDVDAAEEVLVVAGVGWSIYDVRAFAAFAEHVRKRSRRVFAADLDDAGGPDTWQHWSARVFPGVAFDPQAPYLTPWVARYRDGRLDVFEAGHKGHALLYAGVE